MKRKKPLKRKTPLKRSSNPISRSTSPKRSTKRPKRISDSHARMLERYRPLRDEWMQRPENFLCKMKTPVCTGECQAPHHPSGRIGEELLNLEECIPSCHPCNSYVEAHPNWAIEQGLAKKKIGPSKKQPLYKRPTNENTDTGNN